MHQAPNGASRVVWDQGEADATALVPQVHRQYRSYAIGGWPSDLT
jgi:hypothetical protein